MRDDAIMMRAGRIVDRHPVFPIPLVRRPHPAAGAPQGPFASLSPGATPTPTLPLPGRGRTRGTEGPSTLIPPDRGEVGRGAAR